MAGDSHTNFNHQAFAVGAVGGSATIAAALVNGARNAAAVRRSREVLHAVTARDDLISNMQRRIDHQRSELERRDAIIHDQSLAIRELNVRLRMAQWFRQQGR